MASTIHSKLWAAETTIFESAALGDSALSYSSNIDLETSGYEGAHVIVDMTFNASGTSDGRIEVYGSLDGTNYDDIAMFSQSISVSAGNAQQISFIVRDVAHARLGLAHYTSETTNKITANVRHQRWKWKST